MWFWIYGIFSVVGLYATFFYCFEGIKHFIKNGEFSKIYFLSVAMLLTGSIVNLFKLCSEFL